MGGTTPGGEEFQEYPRLRQLRWLVTTLTLTLIFGVITVVVLLVIRLNRLAPPPVLALPAAIHLPAGETARALTAGSDWIAVVTVDGKGIERIRVLDQTTGAERSVTEIAPK